MNRKLATKIIIASVVAAVVFAAAAFAAVSWYFPIRYSEIVHRNAERYGLEPALVFAVIHAESKFDRYAVSRAGASGLMQIMNPTADWAAEIMGLMGYSYDRIFEPELNIQIGCWYLAYLIDRFDYIDTAVSAYNAGEGNVARWLADEQFSSDGVTLDEIPFRETRDYIRRVRFNTMVYRFLLKFYN